MNIRLPCLLVYEIIMHQLGKIMHVREKLCKGRYYFMVVFSLLCTACNQPENKLYRTLSPEETGIRFANTLTYSDTLSVLDFEYLFNGGGVAVGDINNDGLPDLYFSGNMTSGKLYLNKGDLRFEDITNTSGVATDVWANGVTMVDINQDGFRDIFIAVAGTRNTPEEKRKNLLFVNNGDNTFRESAKSYGLAGTGHNIQAAFLDYDNDGDLDVYLLRNAFVEYSRNRARPRSVKGESSTTDQLYRNNGDETFTDVSKEAGVLIEGFGLGVQICDINEDGWQDVYVSNDFITNDLLYINNQDGTFSNQVGKYFRHETYNAMGNDIADFNNDGYVDVVEVDMLPDDNYRWKITIMGNNYDEFENTIKFGYEPQYIRNTLQLNNGNGTFSEIAYFAGVEATDWSWSPLFADVDNDGLKDLFITNGYRQDITNLDFIKFSERASRMGTPEGNKKERLDMLAKIPGIKVHKYMYRNNGDLTFTDKSAEWGVASLAYANGAAYADLDNDGDLDLVTNNIDEPATILRNDLRSRPGPDSSGYLRVGFLGPHLNREGFGSKVRIYCDGELQYQYFTPFRGFLSSVEPYLHFGIKDKKVIDSLEVVWPDGRIQKINKVEINQLLMLDHARSMEAVKTFGNTSTILERVDETSGIDFRHMENDFVDFKVQPLLPHMHSRNGPGLTVGDINGDGLDDIFVGGALGQSGLFFYQGKDGKFTQESMPLDTLADDMGVLLFDANDDGIDDLYISSGGTESKKEATAYTDHLYLNDGKGKFLIADGALPPVQQSGSCVVASDYDHDGDLDLFIGGRIVPGEYPLPAGSTILRNDSEKHRCRFTDVTQEMSPELVGIGMVTAALWTDVDNDGWTDLLIVGEFMPVTYFRNEKGRSFKRLPVTSPGNSTGWWNSISGGDFDGDGDTDYVLGNLGLNTRYRGSVKEPLCVNASDYDKNGSIDPVMSLYVHGEKQVAHSWDDLVRQMPPIRARFRTYAPYAEASFGKSFSVAEIGSSYEICADWFESGYLENRGNGIFSLTALPAPVQFSPVYGMVATDFDDDGNLDVILVGNSYATEVSTGRYDASIGTCLRGLGNGKFTNVPAKESGFLVNQDAKGLVRLVLQDGSEQIIAGINNGKTVSHRIKTKGEYYSPSTDDAFAIVTMRDGRRFKHEFYFGSGYLSSGTRKLRLREDMKEVIIHSYTGEQTVIKK